MDIDELRSRVSAELPRIRQDLEDLVRIESVSADPERAAEVQRSAEAVAELFRAENFEDVQVVSTRDDGGAPHRMMNGHGGTGSRGWEAAGECAAEWAWAAACSSDRNAFF